MPGTNADGSHDSTREFGVAYHSQVESLTSVTGRIGYPSGAVAPGSAMIIRLPRSYLELFMRGARRGRDGPSASAVSMPSPTTAREANPGGAEIVTTKFDEAGQKVSWIAPGVRGSQRDNDCRARRC
jgi:hypothetical protein